MSNRLKKSFKPKTAMTLDWQHFYRGLLATVLTAIVSPTFWSQPAHSQVQGSCLASPADIAEKEQLRQATLEGDQAARDRYQAFLVKEAERLQECRKQTWPQNQALWLRLYPCDLQPGALDALMDRIVNKGYNKVYLEAFYDGQALLPQAENNTVWPSVVRVPGYENADLLAEGIKKGQERGLKVYAWMFTINFGYSYSQLPDRQGALARNGQGQTTLTVMQDPSLHEQVGQSHANHAFIDPYSPQARQDYAGVIREILKRKPDGMLFDYVRYLRGVGPASVVTKPSDLWIYSEASQQTLVQRGLNQKGQELIRRYVTQGSITANDIAAVDALYPNEAEPMWQGRNVPPGAKTMGTPGERLPLLQWQLWYLSVAHAVQGIIDFVHLAVDQVRPQGIPSGAVFFPGGNRPVGQGGFDSRLQAWDRFLPEMEWHPMSYANCQKPDCIMEEVERVLSMAPEGTEVIPALAGDWGVAVTNRPPLEDQMYALRRYSSRINSVSHFAYSWQEPDSDRDRKFCQLN
ncbi:hypothetical protein [Laspinema olomoucense]|uniref:hypothetical protein n=1 Tax=Laspinema olomoucense TaxID=3231600 RepID=UPI0021BBA9D5|nr:hypothetical protein [Laspinema sp. D3d]